MLSEPNLLFGTCSGKRLQQNYMIPHVLMMQDLQGLSENVTAEWRFIKNDPVRLTVAKSLYKCSGKGERFAVASRPLCEVARQVIKEI